MANYITVERAQEIADERLNVEAWDDAVDTDGSDWGDPGTLCVKAATMATRAINQLNYRGEKTVATQDNAFPRGEDPTVPVNIELACFEIMLALLDGIDPAIEFENLSLTSQGYANVRSTYNREVPDVYYTAGIVSVTAWRYLMPYLVDPHALNTARVS